MLTAIDADGFNSHDYGKAYWTDIQTAYTTALKASRDTAGAVSQKVGEKNTGRAYLNKVLVALTKLIEANYPDTSDAELRAWGYQKEGY